MLRSFGEGKMFYCARFHPEDDKQNVILAGCADKKIHQWDSDTGDLEQVSLPKIGGACPLMKACNVLDMGTSSASLADLPEVPSTAHTL